MEKMTLYSGTHTYTHVHTQRTTSADVPHCLCQEKKKSVIECIYLIFMHYLNGSFCVNAFLYLLLSVCVLNKNRAACERVEIASECYFPVEMKST